MTASDHPPAATAGRRSGPVRRRAVVALARTEARRLAGHPLVVAGLLLAAPIGWMITAGHAFVLARESITLPLALLPMAAAVLLAAHGAAGRIVRDRVAAIDSAPLPSVARTVALLAATAGPALVAAVALLASMAGLRLAGAIGAPDWVELAAGPTVVALAGVLGVTLAQLSARRMVAVATVVVVAAVQLVANPAGLVNDPAFTALAWLAPLAAPVDAIADPGVLVRPAGWHLGYLVGAIAVSSAGALVAAGGSTGRRVLPGLAGGVLMVVAGALQLSPPSSAVVDRVARRVAQPAAVGTCAGQALEVCVLPGFEAWRGRLRATTAPVLTRVHQAGIRAPSLRVVQRPDPRTARASLARWGLELPVPDRLLDADPALADNRVQVLPDWPWGDAADRQRLALTLEVARETVGMPFGDRGRVGQRARGGATPPIVPCLAVGQAREVVAVWLAATAVPGGRDALRGLLADEPYGVQIDTPAAGGYALFGAPWHWGLAGDLLFAREDPQWSKVATTLARQLARRDAAAVLGRLAARWARWTSPDAPARALVEAFGLDAPPVGERAPGVRDLPTGEESSRAEYARLFRLSPLPAGGGHAVCR